MQFIRLNILKPGPQGEKEADVRKLKTLLYH